MSYSVDAPDCYICAARAERKEKVRSIRLRIDKKCRAVCTKKSGLKATPNENVVSRPPPASL